MKAEGGFGGRERGIVVGEQDMLIRGWRWPRHILYMYGMS